MSGQVLHAKATKPLLWLSRSLFSCCTAIHHIVIRNFTADFRHDNTISAKVSRWYLLLAGFDDIFDNLRWICLFILFICFEDSAELLIYWLIISAPLAKPYRWSMALWHSHCCRGRDDICSFSWPHLKAERRLFQFNSRRHFVRRKLQLYYITLLIAGTIEYSLIYMIAFWSFLCRAFNGECYHDHFCCLPPSRPQSSIGWRRFRRYSLIEATRIPVITAK